MTTTFRMDELADVPSGRYRLDTSEGSTSPATDLSLTEPVLVVKRGHAPDPVRSPSDRTVLYAKRLGVDDAVLETVTLSGAAPAEPVPAAPSTPAPSGASGTVPTRLAALSFESLTVPVASLVQVTGVFEDTSDGTGLTVNEAGDGIIVAESGLYWVGVNTQVQAGSGVTSLLAAIQQNGSNLAPDGGPFNHLLLLQPDRQTWHQAALHIAAGEIQFLAGIDSDATGDATLNAWGAEIIRIA